jgi:hypothetical protein
MFQAVDKINGPLRFCLIIHSFYLRLGSLPFSGLFPGFPSSSFIAVGFGFLPLCATDITPNP